VPIFTLIVLGVFDCERERFSATVAITGKLATVSPLPPLLEEIVCSVPLLVVIGDSLDIVLHYGLDNL